MIRLDTLEREKVERKLKRKFVDDGEWFIYKLNQKILS